MPMTDAQKRAQERYRKSGVHTQILLKLHKVSDADILARLEEEPSKMGYLKRLVREDIARRAAANEPAPANE